MLLGLGAFVVASDGTLVVGLLRQIAHSLTVSPAAAGQAVTVFAAVYAFCAPLVIRATRRASLKRLLLAAIGLFAVANAATAAAPSLAALLGARALAAACAGVFMATAAALGARMVAPDRRGRALATIVGGASAATALGVPLGTFLGGAVGWRASFYGIAVLTAIVTCATAAMLPPSEETWQAPPGSTRFGAGVLVTLATTLIWATGS